jgi:hypothetical protein
MTEVVETLATLHKQMVTLRHNMRGELTMAENALVNLATDAVADVIESYEDRYECNEERLAP